MKINSIRNAMLVSAGLAALVPVQAVADAVRASAQVPETPVCGPRQPPSPPPAPAAPPPVLVEGLGYAGIAPDTDNAEAKRWFEQGIRLIWAFDEVEAVRSFQQAQKLDPDCALCFWGEAWARGPTINLQPRTPELPAARIAANRAVELGGKLNAHDRYLVRAMRLRMSGKDAFRNEDYASVMETGALRFSSSDIMNVMAADARMVALEKTPAEGALPQRFLERVLARNRGHSGAIHMYIHLTDWIDRQDLAERHADRLGRIAPAASHLVHMPAHTFFGVGRYADAAAVNVAALAADQAYERKVRPPESRYRTGLYTHNAHFAMGGALMRGDGKTALEIAEHFNERFPYRPDEGFRSLIRGSTWYAYGLHADPARVLAMPEPPAQAALLRGIRHYARGEALIRTGDAAGARSEAAAIAKLLDSPEGRALGTQRADRLIQIAQHVLEGRAAMLAGDHEAAMTSFRKGMEIQEGAKFGFDPPPFWYPVRRSLAAAMLAAGQHEKAKHQLVASLEEWPRDPLALYALARAEQALGNRAAAAKALAEAKAGWAGKVEAVPLTRI